MLIFRSLTSIIILTLFLSPTHAQVTADFTSNVNSGCGSLQVSFIDQSSSSAGNIVSWNWDLGGVVSSNQNPGRIFGSPGVYTICLTVNDSEGNTDTECKNDFIEVFNLPEPAFSVDNQFGCAPIEITFTDESNSTDGNITDWVWGLGGTAGVVFDDGSNPTVSSIYQNPDNFTISLTVTDDNGCTNTLTEEDYLTIFDFPVIDISLSDTFNCIAPFIVNLVNNNPEPGVEYFWDFGNGTPVFQGTNPPAVTYAEEGAFTISVIALNSQTNCSDTVILEDVINIGNAIGFTSTAEQLCQGTSVSFNNTSFSGMTNIQWDFGDGNFSGAFSPTYIYNTPGCYFVNLSGTINGCLDTFTNVQCIEVFPLPVVSFSNDNPIGCELPHEVDFVSSTDIGINYFWDFGDGNFSTSENPSHAYLAFGSYPVTLTVQDSNGCENSFSETIEIAELEAIMNLGEISGCTPLNFSVSENSVSLSPIISWEWQIDTSGSFPNSPLYTSSQSEPFFSIVDTGWYDVTLIVQNSLGCSDTIVNYNAVGVGQVPQIDFIATPLVACVDEPITFTDLSSDYGEEWFWDFGDGNFSTDQHPVYDYNTPDTFDVTLTVLHNGCESAVTFEDFIVIVIPVASFEFEQDCSNPYEVVFTDNAVGADSIFWDFGFDEITDTSTVLNPVVTFPGTGCFTVTQIAFNFTTGCIDTLQQDVCIADPIADFSIAPLSGCVPLNVNVTNNSEFDAIYQWTAPGATISNPGAETPVITYANTGVYTDIQLIVSDFLGCSDTIIFTDSIYVDGITVDFVTLPSGGCEPLNVFFFDNSSGFISDLVSWEWNINNGAFITSEQNTSFFFDTSGIYPVALTVTNAWGCVTTLNAPNAVSVTSPSALFLADSISCPADTVSFNNLSTGEELTYLWDFGDGSFSTDSMPEYQFPNLGIHEVCLTITDFAGCQKIHCQSVEIVNPIADFTLDTTFSECPPLVVFFENQSQNGIFYDWDFGDNSGVSDLENPPHIYTIPGSYDVQLVTSINSNCTDTLLIEDLILLEGPVGDFSFDEDTACVGELITFFGNSDGDYTYIWDFGDGMLDTTQNVSTDTITHTYFAAGAYVPKLILVDSENCHRTLESPDTIYIGLLEIDFIASDTALCEELGAVQFINLINSSSSITDFQWIFENGNPATSTAFEPTVSFPNMGSFDVSLIVANVFCRDTLTKVNFIGAGDIPVADFSVSDDSGCIPHGVQFSDQSSVSNGVISDWEWTFDEVGGSDEANPSFVFTAPGVYDVQLVITTEHGCVDTSSSTISVYGPIAPLIVLSEPEICIGDIVQLNAITFVDTADFDYSWLPDPTLSCLDCFDPFANPTTTTSYFFITTTNQGCSDTSEIQVNVLPFSIPEISITPDTTLCTGESIQINAFSSGTVDYQWDQSVEGLSCYDNCNNPLASPDEPTMYSLTVTNSDGCDAVDSVFIDLIDQNQPFAGPDRTICLGDTVQLELLVDGTPIWLNNNGLSCFDCTNPLAYPVQSTSYFVQTITDDFSCQILDTINVNVLSPDDISAGEDIQICIGESVTLNAFSQAEGAISWTPSTGLDADDIINPTATPLDTTTYLLSVENDLCVLEDSVEIVVQFITEVESFDYEICLGDTVKLNFIGEADDIEWSPAISLSDPLSETPLAFPVETTSYLLDASLSTCTEDTALATVTVNEGPEIIGPDRYDKFPGFDVQFEVEVISGSGNYSYEWLRTDGLSCSNCPNPVLSIDTSGFYILVVTDELNGCQAEHRVFINKLRTCNPDLIVVPNIFSPNDDGYNDEIRIYSQTISEIYTFKIFNRWGALLYATQDINETWDGRFKNELLPSGVYVYYIEAPCSIDGSRVLKKGDFTLVR